MLREIASEDVRILPDLAEVDALASLTTAGGCEKEEAVEVLEQERVGLMDSDENGLTCARQLSQETNDVEC